MGSTGHGNASKSDFNSDTFGVEKAVAFKGNLPEKTGLEKVSSNNITLKVPVNNKTNIFFQFKLTKDNKYMNILAYRDGVPEEKAKVRVDSHRPSLDSIPNKVAAVKMKRLMHESQTIDENQLGKIANALLLKKGKKKG